MIQNQTIRYVSAWRRRDPALERDAVAMWTEMKILPAGVKPEDRARELCVLAYHGDRLVGITTAQIQPYAPVRQRFAWGRILLRPECRKIRACGPPHHRHARGTARMVGGEPR